MKQKHLYSLLDTTYTTVGVVFTASDEYPPAPAMPTGQVPRSQRTQKSAPWAMPDNTGSDHYGQKAYTYKVPKDAGVEVDDYVVVHSSHRGLAIGRVVRVDDVPQIDLDANFDYKWIVQRIDREGYQQRVTAERGFADAMREIERVRQRDSMLDQFTSQLPAGSEARQLFDRTVANVRGTTVDNAPPPAPEA